MKRLIILIAVIFMVLGGMTGLTFADDIPPLFDNLIEFDVSAFVDTVYLFDEGKIAGGAGFVMAKAFDGILELRLEVVDTLDSGDGVATLYGGGIGANITQAIVKAGGEWELPFSMTAGILALVDVNDFPDDVDDIIWAGYLTVIKYEFDIPALPSFLGGSG